MCISPAAMATSTIYKALDSNCFDVCVYCHRLVGLQIKHRWPDWSSARYLWTLRPHSPLGWLYLIAAGGLLRDDAHSRGVQSFGAHRAAAKLPDSTCAARRARNRAIPKTRVRVDFPNCLSRCPLLAVSCPLLRADWRTQLDRPRCKQTPADIGMRRCPRRSGRKPLQDFAFCDSKVIGFLPATLSFAFNAGSSFTLSASHFCSDASSIPLSLV